LRHLGIAGLSECEVVRAAQEGDRAALGLLCERLRPSVETIAWKHRWGRVPVEDLIQEGFVELIWALGRFDRSRGVPFWVYARPSVEGEVKRRARRRRAISLSVRDAGDVAKLAATKDALREQLGAEPTLAEVALELGLSVERGRRLELAARDVLSLDLPLEQATASDDSCDGQAWEAGESRWDASSVKQLFEVYPAIRARVAGSRAQGRSGGDAQSARPGAWAHAWLVDFEAALEHMPRKEFAVVELVGLQGLSPKEAADRLNVSERTVYSGWRKGVDWLCTFLNNPDQRISSAEGIDQAKAA
jgi:DNA-directed RNA polymerase specialized sigma subunit